MTPIADIKATTVAVPLEAPLRHANGTHWGGHDPIALEQLRWKLMNPTASLYNNRMQLHAAIEMACMDLAGKQKNLRACDLLGGAIRESVPFASYLFYRYENDAGTAGGETTADEVVAMARRLPRRHAAP